MICTSINSHINPELPKLRPLKPYVAYDFSILETDEIFDAVCPHIDFAITSCGDASMEEIQRRCERIHQRGCRYVIASRGKNGSVFSDGEHLFTHPAYLVEALDTLGAGDSFLTAFLLSFVEWLEGNHDPSELEGAVMAADGRRQQVLRKPAWSTARLATASSLNNLDTFLFSYIFNLFFVWQNSRGLTQSVSPVVLIRGNFVPVLTWISFYEGKDFCQFSPSRGHATHNPFPRPAASVTWLLRIKARGS